MSRPVVIFASRRFPPSTGGMETHSKAVHDALRREADVISFTLGRSSHAHLAWWLPLLIVRVAAALVTRRVDVVVAADPIVLAVLRPLLVVRRIPSVVFVYGLDLTYSNPLYHLLIRRPLRTCDQVVAISRATADVAESTGIAPERIVVVPAATEMSEISDVGEASGLALRRRFGLPPDVRVLVTLGRLVPRKGVAWFAEYVMPGLGSDVHHLVAGSGTDLERIEAAVAAAGVGDRVHLLGRVDESDRELLLSGADVFVMPNVKVPNDMEGFGLVAVEAALHGSVVVASGIEGIKDAVIDGETGILVEAGDPSAFHESLARLLADDDGRQRIASRFADEARRFYGPDATAERLWNAVARVLT